MRRIAPVADKGASGKVSSILYTLWCETPSSCCVDDYAMSSLTTHISRRRHSKHRGTYLGTSGLVVGKYLWYLGTYLLHILLRVICYAQTTTSKKAKMILAFVVLPCYIAKTTQKRHPKKVKKYLGVYLSITITYYMY